MTPDDRVLATTEPIHADVDKVYKFGNKIGEGKTSVVYAATEILTGMVVAVKKIPKAKLDALHFTSLGDEITFLRKLRHPHIIELFGVYMDKDHYFLVTEYMAGGELFDRIVERETYSENDARVIVQLILEAVAFCHDHDIVHRDLKPENLLLLSARDHTTLKLGDFGYAAHAPECTLTAPCGSPSYVAPEVIKGQMYGKPVDVWSLGVITFILLCGYPPFYGSSKVELYSQIKAGTYTCPPEMSSLAKDFVGCMLTVDPLQRPTVAQMLDHPWLVDDRLCSASMVSTIEELRRFNTRRKFRAVVRAVQACDAFLKRSNSGLPPKKRSPPSKRRSWFAGLRIFPGH